MNAVADAGAGALHVLSAGAAQGLVQALQGRFSEASGASVDALFGAVGAMKEALLAGAPCDVMIVTDAMVDALVSSGHLRADTRAALGRVRTGIAVRSGDARPDISSAAALRASLLAADALYFPDPVRATAGIHFANVMKTLGVHAKLESRFRTFPNGAAAMRELAATTVLRLIGCTQVTEIMLAEGVSLVGNLPQEFELATVYTAAVNVRARQPELAARFIALASGASTQPLRAQLGFD